MPSLEPIDPTTREAVTKRLLDYGESLTPADLTAPPTFTANPDANALVRANAFAFLLAVLLDQSIPAERAWEGPYLLRQRLKHLDPRRMVEDPLAVHQAVNRRKPRALHCYVNNMPTWLVVAARRDPGSALGAGASLGTQ